jgi:hypothetical protein
VPKRDLHKEVREILPLQEQWDAPVSADRDNALNRLQEGLDRLAILLIAAFTFLRRLADEVIDASRPLLFEKWQSAPRQMKVAKRHAEDGKFVVHARLAAEQRDG